MRKEGKGERESGKTEKTEREEGYGEEHGHIAHK
jgi:hypothetical protein